MMAPYISISLMLAVLITSAWGRCPDQSLIEPCTCEQRLRIGKEYYRNIIRKTKSHYIDGDFPVVRCSEISTVDDLQKVIDNTLDYPFDMFLLRDSTIPYLNSTWFTVKSINHITLSNNTLLGMFQQVPVETLPWVSSIEVKNTSLFKTGQWSAFKPFVKLGWLRVSETEVKRLGKEFRDNVSPELKLLSMNLTQTEKLEDGVFAGKKNLSNIKIIRGKLRTLPTSLFEDQKEVLEWLDFSYNPIESLPDDLFQGMKNLIFVKLEGAEIKTLSRGMYVGGMFSLMGNPLICDCKMSWVSTANLEPVLRDDGTYNYIFGICASPPNLQSKQLRNLIKEDFKACD